MSYKLVKDVLTNEISVVNKTDGDRVKSIPFDPSNKDYQEYLEWVAEGNQPEEAD